MPAPDLNLNKDRSLYPYFKPFIGRFFIAMFFMALVALFTNMLPITLNVIIDELYIQGSKGSIQMIPERAMWLRNFIIHFFHVDKQHLASFLPQLLFFSFLGQAVFTFFSLYLMKTLGLKVVRNIRDKVYRNLVHQSIDFLSKAKTGDLVSRLSNDIEKIKYATAETITVYIRESLTLAGLLWLTFRIDWQMALISLALVPVTAFPLIYFARKVKKRGIQSQETIGELSNFLAETVIGNKIVKAYNMEEFEINKFRQLNQKNYRINAKIALAYSLLAPFMDVIGGIVAAGIFTVGMQRIAAGTLSPGQFVGFLSALFMMYRPLKQIPQAHNDFQQGKAGFSRVQQIIANEKDRQERTAAVEVKHIHGEVEFNNVSFAYIPAIPVLNSISFRVRPGEVVAIVGASGSGKSTMMNLLLRFYDVGSGEIMIDGKDIQMMTLKSLRTHIGLVTQDVFLFNDSVKNNIAYGEKDYSQIDIERAAKIARAHDFITDLPVQYDTIVGERGLFLSNGQRQRISIARAILKNPAILIFDEATSSLDSESESLIQEAMIDVMKDRTTFVIAHRLSTIIEANCILVLENGCICESGNHRELLKKRGLYYSLYNLQFPHMNIIM